MAETQVLILKVSESFNMKKSLDFAFGNGYGHGIMTSITNPLFRREFADEELAENHLQFTRSPMILESFEWRYVTPVITVQNLSAINQEVAKNNELQFIQEMKFAYHVKDAGYILIQLGDNDPEVLGKLVKRILKPTYDTRIVLEIPIVDSTVMMAAYRNDLPEDFEGQDQWQIWHKFHKATGFSTMVQLALVWSPDLPSKEEIRRWFGESIAMLIIPHNCFKLNNSICPVLPAPHSYSVLKFLQYTKCSIVIEPREAFSDKSKSFADYIKFISKRVEVTSSSGNEDSLRFPLQPLYDDLSSATYEIFETDPCKYVKYQMALERAFFDFGEGEDKEKKKIVVLIVGAGRGPLIRAALNASRNTGIKIRTLVVEKNPNAIVTLTSLIKTMWKFDDIKLIAKDMRKVELKEKADILVSELLGSIGDNELSPECLDGAQQLLKPTGISIPSDSVAYIRPVMASKAYSEVIDKKFPMHETGQKSHAEMNWLSYLSNVYFIDKPQELWTFYHPNQDEVIDNNRYKSITFTAKLDCYLHGFSGYFTSTLYKEIEISILPKTHTKGMASWYSMFLPIVSPFMIKKGEKFSLQIWRKVKAEKMVWYEYEITHPDGTTSERMNKDGWNHPIYLDMEMDNLKLDD